MVPRPPGISTASVGIVRLRHSATLGSCSHRSRVLPTLFWDHSAHPNSPKKKSTFRASFSRNANLSPNAVITIRPSPSRSNEAAGALDTVVTARSPAINPTAIELENRVTATKRRNEHNIIVADWPQMTQHPRRPGRFAPFGACCRSQLVLLR